MSMNSSKTFAVAWCLMWGLAHIIAAVVYPDLAVSSAFPDPPTALVGLLILIPTIFYFLVPQKVNKTVNIISRIALMIVGGLMTYGGIISWTGLVVWNVPFPNLEIFQVSMAFADLIAAVFLMFLAIEEG